MAELKAGRELDKLVAFGIFGREYKENPRMMQTGGWEVDGRAMELPHYSTQIAAAWEIVEHMQGHPKSGLFHFRMDGTSLLRLSASEVAEAICLAALKAVGYEG